MKPSLLTLGALGYFLYPVVSAQVLGVKVEGGPDGVSFVAFGVPLIIATAVLMSTGR